LCVELSKKDIIVCFAGVKGRALRALYKSGMIHLVGKSHFFHRVHDAFLAAVTNRVRYVIKYILISKITTTVNEEAHLNHIRININMKLPWCNQKEQNDTLETPRESRAGSLETYEVKGEDSVQNEPV
jgi:hypothetical protein